jgi:SAM-dependent methyltransferase
MELALTREDSFDPPYRRELVEACYRAILGRPPEDAEAVERKLRAGSLQDIIREFVESEEFLAARSTPMPDLRDQYFQPAPQIAVDATPAQLKALFARLQLQWQALGEREPFWSVITHSEYKLEEFDDETRARFFASGAEHAALTDIFCERNAVKVKRGLCVELGCGVGRVTQHLAASFDKVLAIDISEGNLAECRKMADARGLANIETRLLISPEDLKDLPPIDFFYSMIVLQHDPPPVQKYILDIIFGKIAACGGFLFQAQTYAPFDSFSVEDHLASPLHTMDMHSLPMHEILRLAEKHGLSIREVLPDNWTGRFGSHTFFGVNERVEERVSKASSPARFSIDPVKPARKHDLNGDLRNDLRNFTSRLEENAMHLEKQSFQSQVAAKAGVPEDKGREPRQSFWGRLNSYLNSIKCLTRTRRHIDHLESDFTRFKTAILDTTDRRFAEVDEAIQQSSTLAESKHTAMGALIARQANELKQLKQLLRFERATRQKSFGDFDRRLAACAYRQPTEAAADLSPAPAPFAQELPGLQSLLETFYFLLEERYRGSRDEIKQRLTIYRKDFEALRARLHDSGPIIDLGCGRGELLELLREDAFQVLGIDQNDIQLEAARQKGLPVLHAEVRSYLAGLADESVLAVTGIHIVEHLPFPVLTELMQHIARVLKRGGLVIFETPNPRNLIVGANTFHFDPTHIKPLPPEVLEVLFDTFGFTHIETRLLHPSDTLDGMIEQKRLDPHIAGLLFGPQDYAVLGIKG